MKHNFIIGMKVERLDRKPFKSGLLANTIRCYDLLDDQYAATFHEDGQVVHLASLKKAEDYFPEDFAHNSGMRRCHFCHWHPGTGTSIDHPHWFKRLFLSVFVCFPCAYAQDMKKAAQKMIKT